MTLPRWIVLALGALAACSEPVRAPEQVSALTNVEDDIVSPVLLRDLEDGHGNAMGINSNGQAVGESRPNREPNDCVLRAVLWQSGELLDLGVPAGYCDSGAQAVANGGQVALVAHTKEGLQHTFTWSAANGFTPVATDAPSTVPYGISEAGVVVGIVERVDGWTAFRWSSQSGVADLKGPWVGRTNAYDVNSQGFIVGDADSPDGITRAAIWDPAGTPTILLLPAGIWATSSAVEINESGAVIGQVYDDYGRSSLVYWPGASAPQLVSAPTAFTDVIPHGWTNNRIAVGSVSVKSRAHGFAWSPRWGFLLLQPLHEGGECVAYAANERGEVVGFCSDPIAGQKSVLWRLPGRWTALL